MTETKDDLYSDLHAIAGRYLFLLHNAETPLPRNLPWEALENRIVVGLHAGPEPLLSGFGFEPDRRAEAWASTSSSDRSGAAPRGY